MRWIAIFGITLATFVGCSLEDALENAPCDTDDDCVGGQACVRTAHQTAIADLGICRSDGQCAAGEQEGCATNPDGTCSDYLLYAICSDGTGACYCCDSMDSVVIADPLDPSSAQCLSGDITNSECSTASDCAGGMGFVCTRTLEQEAEPDEVLTEEQSVEDGWCRPTSAPDCVGGEQEGCRTESGCPGSGLLEVCAGSRCYCCDSPANTNEFEAHVYTDTEAGESAACVECPRDCVAGEEPCTTLEDPACVISSGVCGCKPS